MFTEKASGARDDRPELARSLGDVLRAGDTLVDRPRHLNPSRPAINCQPNLFKCLDKLIHQTRRLVVRSVSIGPLVVWRLDRLARSLKMLIATAEELERQKIGLVSLTESIDTTTPGGMLTFHVFGAIAQFERALIRERTTAGLVEARRRGAREGVLRQCAHRT